MRRGQFLEYCNHPGGTYLSDLRAKHGYAEPHGVKFWCLGNEMDGPWQSVKDCDRIWSNGKRTAKVMKFIDPGGPVSRLWLFPSNMPTFGAWEYDEYWSTLSTMSISFRCICITKTRSTMCSSFLGNMKTWIVSSRKRLRLVTPLQAKTTSASESCSRRRMERLV